MKPTGRSILLLVACLPVAALPALAGARFWVVWLAAAALVLLLTGADGALLLARRRVDLELHAPDQLWIGRPGRLGLAVALGGRARPARVEVLVEAGDILAPVPARVLEPDVRGRCEGSFPLTAHRRGRAVLTAVWIRWRGPLGLAQHVRRLDRDDEIPVVPDIQSVRGAALRFFGSREFTSGLKLEEYAGDGSEFDRLREFVPGLDSRSIDWKASARHTKLLSREYRAERNHQIVIAIDTGRLMGERIAGVPKLDHAINAGLLLTWYSLYAGRPRGPVRLRHRRATCTANPRAGCARFRPCTWPRRAWTTAPARPTSPWAWPDLSTLLRQRSLVVVMTDFVDAITARLMQENLQRLSRKHLVMFVALRNPELEALATARPGDVTAMARGVVAADILQEREIVLRELRRFGILTVDAAPGEIAGELLNRYLDIKRREQIA